MVFLQLYMIMLGARLPKAENKRICQISALKSSRSCLRNLSSGLLQESFLKRYLTEKQNNYFQISGHLGEVVAMRESTVGIYMKRVLSIKETVSVVFSLKYVGIRLSKESGNFGIYLPSFTDAGKFAP